MCVDNGNTVRNVGVSFLYDSVTAPFYFGAIAPSNSFTIQSVDTTTTPPVGTSSTGASFFSTTVGEHLLTSNTGWNATVCNLAPTTYQTDQPFHLNLVKCAPQFNHPKPPYDALTVHLSPVTPPTTISVYLPSTMSGAQAALDGAIADWNSHLPAGVQFASTNTACGTGPSCISIGKIVLQNVCGDSNWNFDPATGEILSNATLSLRADWDQLPYSSQGLQRTFAHELGHFLGLSDYPSPCGVSDAAMQDTFSCVSSSTTTAVTFNDYAPSSKAVYGGGSRAICGF
jgi:hypothetical protein